MIALMEQGVQKAAPYAKGAMDVLAGFALANGWLQFLNSAATLVLTVTGVVYTIIRIKGEWDKRKGK